MAPMVAVNSGDLDFYHVGGIIRLTILTPDSGIRKIRVTFNGISYVTGTYTVSNAGTTSAYTTLLSGSHNYVEFTKSEDFSLITILNIPVPTGDYSACTGLSVGLFDSSSSLIDTYNISIPWISIGRGKGKKEITDCIDLSLVHPITRASMSRETANCYIVTEPGCYKLPLYYGNAIVGGEDNISTAAPAKGDQANYGVFVNAYDVAVSSGNIKTDLESSSRTLNTFGGKLIWSTASSSSSTLVLVDASLYVIGNEAYMMFVIPEDGFQEGSALIGVLKSGSTTEYVWAWHIWITDGSVLATDAYTNNQSQTIDILNRPLGGRGGTSLVNVYYQYGMPFPLPPSDGTSYSMYTARLYDENGTYTFTYDSGNTITTLGKALSKPYLPRWSSDFFNTAAGAAQNFYNMWDATQTSTATDKMVVKTIYDPSPAGMTIPRFRAFTGFTTTGNNVTSGAPTNCNVVGSFSQGWYFKRNSSDATGVFWAASGNRGSSSLPGNVSSSGVFWSAGLRSSTEDYCLSFGSTSISTASRCTRYGACSVRPALSEL